MTGSKKGSEAVNPFEESPSGSSKGTDDSEVAEETSQDSQDNTSSAELSMNSTPDDSETDEKDQSSSSSTNMSSSSPSSSGQPAPSVPTTVEIDGSPNEIADLVIPDDYDSPHAWALGRGTVKSGREEVQFALTEHTQDLEDDAHDSVEDILGQEIKTTDLREAAVALGYSSPETLAEILTSWGSDYA